MKEASRRQWLIITGIGALVGLLIVTMLAANARPAYDIYLMPLAQYRDMEAWGRVVDALFRINLPLVLVGLTAVLFLIVWFMVAGRLNPVLAQLPFARGARPLLAWTAWVSAALVVVVAVLFAAWFNANVETRAGWLVNYLAGVMAGGVVWVLVAPQAFGRFGRDVPGVLQWSAVVRAFLLGAAFVLLFMLLAYALSAGFFNVYLKYIDQVWNRGFEPSPFGLVWLAIGAMVLSAVVFALCFSLLPLFIPGAGDWRARLRAARTGGKIMAVGGGVALLSLLTFYQSHFLGKTTLMEAAGLQDIQPLVFHRVMLCAATPCRVTGDAAQRTALAVGEPIATVKPLISYQPDGQTPELPLHPDLVTRLEQFALHEGRHSALRKAALMAALATPAELWQPRSVYALHDRWTQDGTMPYGHLLYTQIRLAWLARHAPINAGTRAMLEELSDERHYHIGSRAAVQLAWGWARFGDLTRARALLERARQAEPGRYDHVLLVPGKLGNGRVHGRIELTGRAVENVRVGLFRMTDDDPTRYPGPKRTGAAAPAAFTGTQLVRLTDSALLKANGRFAFQDLGAGDYFIALLVPDAALRAGERLTGDNVPDRIVLGATRPQRDLGVIRLAVQPEKRAR